MGGAGLEFESGLPKQHLTLMDNAPVWNEEVELEFDATTIFMSTGMIAFIIGVASEH